MKLLWKYRYGFEIKTTLFNRNNSYNEGLQSFINRPFCVYCFLSLLKLSLAWDERCFSGYNIKTNNIIVISL